MQDADIPVFSVTNSNGFCTEYFSKEVASKDKTTYKIVKKGFFAYNPSRINVGSVDWLRDKNEVIVSPLYNVFSVDDGLDQQYLYYYLKSPIGLYYIKELASGSVRDNLKFSILSEFRIPLPEMKLQKEVAKTLDRIIEIISICNTILETLDLLVKSRFVEMFGDPVSDTKGWGQKPFRDLLDNIRYGASTPPEFVENGYAFIRATNIKNGRIVDKDMKYIPQNEADRLAKCKLMGGEILIVRSGVNAGDTCVVTDKYIGQYAGYDMILVLKKELNPVFLNLLINTSYMERIVKPLTRRAAQPHLNSEQVQSFPIIQVPIELQNEFAAFVAHTDKSKYSALKIKENIRRAKFYDQF